MKTTETRIDVAGDDYRRCKTCLQLVPMGGSRCLCEMVQDAHLADIRRNRQLAGFEVGSLDGQTALYSSRAEQGMEDSDAQDAPIPLPEPFLFRLTCILAAVIVGALVIGSVGWFIWVSSLPH